MKPVTHYEVYQVKFDRWALRQRLSTGEEARAVEYGRETEVESGRAVQVIEENLDPETGQTTLKVLARFGKIEAGIKGPPEDTNIGSRIVMVAFNAVGIGAIVTVIAAILLAPLHARSDAAGAYNMLLLFIFAAAMLAGGLTLFRMYVPIELILWRAKTPEARARMTEMLIHGGVREEAPRPVRPPFRNAAPIPAPTLAPMAATSEDQTSFQISALPQASEAAPGETAPPSLDGAPPADGAAPAPAAAPAPTYAPEIIAAREAVRAALLTFTDAALGLLALTRPPLQGFDRFGLNLYLVGAAGKACELAELPQAQPPLILPPEVKRELQGVPLERAGTNSAAVQSFVERLDASLSRPRYKALVDAGADAFTMPPDENGQPRHERLADLLREWSDPAARGARAETVTFLLTDIVGSTALTAKLGNSAAQRVVRAHNSVARAAVKDFRGKEIKHTGDGMLLTFTDPAMAAKAGIYIQQEAGAYARDNPEAPLSLRVGLHSGPASAEDGGEYAGEAVLLLDGICAAAEAGQITCSEEIAARAGSAFRFTDLGPKQLKGTEIERRVFRLDWTPKTKAPGPLEYRQIGGVAGS